MGHSAHPQPSADRLGLMRRPAPDALIPPDVVSSKPAGMNEAASRSEWPGKKVRDWLLAILRFAVTRDDSDRTSVMAAAGELDRLGSSSDDVSFSFFIRTSSDLCDAIVEVQNSHRCRVLTAFLKRVEDRRLRLALEAAFECPSRSPALPRIKRHSREDLWRGLRPR